MKTLQIVRVRLFLFLLYVLLAGSAGATNYTLTMTVQGSGTISTNPTFASYPSNVVLTITGTPSAGWYFANWSGDVNSTVNPLNVTVDSNLVITATFLAYPTYTLALATNGQGTIALSPPGGGYLSNTLVTATGTAAAGWVFAGWSGATNSSANPVSVAVNTNGTLTGTFAEWPAFDVQPVSVTNRAGSTVSFASHAVGTGPLNYQWYFSGGALGTVTDNSMLSLTSVGPGAAGTYWVVVTNNYGSATSQVASLTLTNSVGPANIVSSPTEASLVAAIQTGGWIGIGFNGTLTLTNTITITNNVVLDGTGVAATISGGSTVQIFYVTSTGNLTITNLTLANGNCLVTNGAVGTPADGGAIYNNGGAVTLVSCTLKNNAAQSLIYGGLARGGAIFDNGGTVLLLASSVSNNAVIGGGPNSPVSGTITVDTGLGGAIYNTNGDVTIVDCVVSSNLSTSVCEPSNYGFGGSGLTMGGAVFQASGSMGITNSSFTMNHAVGGTGAQSEGSLFPAGPAEGGAVAVTGGGLWIELSQFINNQADGAPGFPGTEGGGAGPACGGAIYCSTACWVADSSIARNQALAGNYNAWGPDLGAGGGIYNDAGGMMTLNRCAIYDNIAQGGAMETENPIIGGAGLGGGIYNAEQLAVTNCTIALNSAIGAPAYRTDGPYNNIGGTGNAIGGGVYNSVNATSVVMSLTIAANDCSSPGVSNTDYVSTSGVASGSQIANTNGLFSVHNTLIAYGTNSNAYGPITDVGYNISSDGSASLFSGSSYNYTDPQLAPLGNYGGPTLCVALLPTSPAIDNGDINGCPSTDQRGFVRPAGSGPDIGAYEYGSSPAGVPYVYINPSGTNVQLSFTAFPSGTYYLQYSTNLTTWINLSTNGPFGSATIVNQSIGRQRGNCFFRVLLQ